MPSRATSTGSPQADCGLAPVLPGRRGEDRHVGALGDHRQLVDGVRALQVGGDQQRRVALGLEVHGELAGQGRLARALQAREQDHGGRRLGQPEPPGLPTEQLDELLVDDLDDLLRGVQRPGDLGTHRPLADPVGEHADGRQRDVGLEQRHPDLADGRGDVGLGQPALAAQALEGRGQSVGQGCEHEPRFYRRGGAPDCARARAETDAIPSQRPPAGRQGSGRAPPERGESGQRRLPDPPASTRTSAHRRSPGG